MASAVDRCTGSVGARMVGGGGENKDEWLTGGVKIKGFPTLLGVRGQVGSSFSVSFYLYPVSTNR